MADSTDPKTTKLARKPAKRPGPNGKRAVGLDNDSEQIVLEERVQDRVLEIGHPVEIVVVDVGDDDGRRPGGLVLGGGMGGRATAHETRQGAEEQRNDGRAEGARPGPFLLEIHGITLAQRMAPVNDGGPEGNDGGRSGTVGWWS